MICTVSLCIFIWVSLGGFLSKSQPLLYVGNENQVDRRRWKKQRCHKTIREAEMSKDNSERFFSSAARPGAPALRSVSVVVGKKNPLMPPLQPRSSLASTLLFQPADSNLVASTTLVQRLRQGPECRSLWVDSPIQDSVQDFQNSHPFALLRSSIRSPACCCRSSEFLASDIEFESISTCAYKVW